ncbi:hypothetical protein VT84_08155 [Gemmata sp. SH-PL17]|nr:hypothetical protein VT84_08155 [Gemmata sp. SH-PL17]
MARVRLYLMPAANNTVFRFVRPGGQRDSIPALRLRALVSLIAHVRPGGPASARAGLPECIVDTGSHLTVIPEYIWRHFYPGAVTPLPFDSAMSHVQRSVSLGGGTFPYELGELAVQLTDYSHRTMDLRVVAQLTHDNGVLTIPMVLGLSGGVTDGRVLRAEPDPSAPFGQAWSLEDP